jgi:hypothetical protein
LALHSLLEPLHLQYVPLVLESRTLLLDQLRSWAGGVQNFSKP